MLARGGIGNAARLDLKGGSQLVLQVQIQDAFKAEADTAIERMKETIKDIPFTEISRNDPKTLADAGSIQIDVKGVPATKAADFRTLVNDQFGGVWILTSVNSTDFRMTSVYRVGSARADRPLGRPLMPRGEVSSQLDWRGGRRSARGAVAGYDPDRAANEVA